MGLFSEFKDGFNSERNKAHTEAEAGRIRKIIKLIEPNYGRIVTLQVMEKEPALSMMIDMLTTITGYQNTSVTTSGNVVTFTFENATFAEIFRSTWRD